MDLVRANAELARLAAAPASPANIASPRLVCRIAAINILANAPSSSRAARSIAAGS